MDNVSLIRIEAGDLNDAKSVLIIFVDQVSTYLMKGSITLTMLLLLLFLYFCLMLNYFRHYTRVYKYYISGILTIPFLCGCAVLTFLFLTIVFSSRAHFYTISN